MRELTAVQRTSTETAPSPAGTAAPARDEDAQLRELAHKLDCFTEADLLLLAKVTPVTAESWRKRGKGPAYLVFGNRVLYPRTAVAEHLQNLVRERSQPPLAKGLL
jgi:hypothetical protein